MWLYDNTKNIYSSNSTRNSNRAFYCMIYRSMESKITVSLDLSKRMKEAWWDKATRFEWDINGRVWNWFSTKEESKFDDRERYKLPTAQEILDVLPKRIRFREYKGRRWNMHIDISDHGWEDFYLLRYSNDAIEMEYYKLWLIEWSNLAEALWELWIWCEKNWYLGSKNTNE